MLIEGKTELIFAQAVSLSQSGKMKSTIHAGKKSIFIINMDSTILLFFKSHQEFSDPFSFFANDYESNNIIVRDGKIVFITKKGEIRREKVCPAPKEIWEEIRKYWKDHKPEEKIFFKITSDVIPFLDDELSHVEIGKEEKKTIFLVQRDIYSGSKVEISFEKEGFDLEEDVEIPVFGLRTGDFKTLFNFEPYITFYPQTGKNWIYFCGSTGRFQGIIATCLYDELGYVAGEGGK